MSKLDDLLSALSTTADQRVNAAMDKYTNIFGGPSPDQPVQVPKQQEAEIASQRAQTTVEALNPQQPAPEEAPLTPEQRLAQISGVTDIDPKKEYIEVKTPDGKSKLVDATSSDGDNITRAIRNTYNNTTERGYALDTWEVPHGGKKQQEAFFNSNKGQKQREAAARILGISPEQVTAEHIFTLGQNAAKERARLIAEHGGLVGSVELGDVRNDPTTGNRVLSSTKLADGTDLRDLLNTPLLNADFYSKYNSRGRRDYELGSTKNPDGGAVLSDAEAANPSAVGSLVQIGTSAIDAFLRTGLGGVNAAANTGVQIAAALQGEGIQDLTPEDRQIFDRIRDTEKKGKTLLSKIEKDPVASKIDVIDQMTNQAIEATGGTPEQPVDKLDKYMQEALAPEEYAIWKGTAKRPDTPIQNNALDSLTKKPEGILDTLSQSAGLAAGLIFGFGTVKAAANPSAAIQQARQQVEGTGLVDKTDKTKFQRYSEVKQQQETAAKAIANPVDTVLGTEGRNDQQDRFRVNAKTGRAEYVPMHNAYGDKAAMEILDAGAERMVKAGEKGDYIGVVSEAASTLYDVVTKEKTATASAFADVIGLAAATMFNKKGAVEEGTGFVGKLAGFVKNLPKGANGPQALNTAFKAANIVGLQQDKLTEMETKFTELNKGEAPTPEEYEKIKDLSVVASAVDLLGIAMFTGPGGKAMSEMLSKATTKKAGQFASKVLAEMAGTGINGLDEVAVEAITQLGTRQRQGDFDKKAWAVSFLQGAQAKAPGAVLEVATKGIPSIPGDVLDGTVKAVKMYQRVNDVAKGHKFTIDEEGNVHFKGKVMPGMVPPDPETGKYPTEVPKDVEKAIKQMIYKGQGDAVVKHIANTRAVLEGEFTEEDLQKRIITPSVDIVTEASMAADQAFVDTAEVESPETGETVPAEPAVPQELDVTNPEEVIAVLKNQDIPVVQRAAITLAVQSRMQTIYGQTVAQMQEAMTKGELEGDKAEAAIALLDQYEAWIDVLSTQVDSLPKNERVEAGVIYQEKGDQLLADIIRGSAPEVTKQDTAKSPLVQSYKKVLDYINTRDEEDNKTADDVRKEVLQDGENASGKKGLMTHMKALAVAGISKNPEALAYARAEVNSFLASQTDKLNKLKEAVDAYEESGNPVPVYFKSNIAKKEPNFVVDNPGKVRNFIKVIEQEVQMIGEVAKMGDELHNKLKNNEPILEDALEKQLKETGKKVSDIANAPKQNQKKEDNVATQKEDKAPVNAEVQTTDKADTAPTKTQVDAKKVEDKPKEKPVAKKAKKKKEKPKVDVLGDEVKAEPTPEEIKKDTEDAKQQQEKTKEQWLEDPLVADIKAAFEEAQNQDPEDNADIADLKPVLDLTKTEKVAKETSKEATPMVKTIQSHTKNVSILMKQISSRRYMPPGLKKLMESGKQLTTDYFLKGRKNPTGLLALPSLTAIGNYLKDVGDTGLEAFRADLLGELGPAMKKELFKQFQNSANYVIGRKLSLDKLATSPIGLFLNEKNELAPQLRNAMLHTAVEWIADKSVASVLKTDKEVYASLGLDIKSDFITPSVLDALRDMGELRSKLAEQLGNRVLEGLGIDLNSDVPDAGFRQRLVGSIGLSMLSAMANIKDKKGEPIIHFNRVPSELMAELTETASVSMEASPVYVSLNIQRDEYQRPVMDQSGRVRVNNLLAYKIRKKTNQSKEIYKKYMELAFGKKPITRTTSYKPFKMRKPEDIKDRPTRNNSYGQLSEAELDHVNQLQQVAFKANPLIKMMDLKEGRMAIAKMFGYVEPTRDGDIPSLPLDKVKGQLAKNEAIIRDLDAVLDKLSEQDQTIEELTKARDEATDPKDRERLQRELNQARKKEIYFPFKISTFGRALDNAQDLSIQRSKIHRNIFTPAESTHTFPMSDTKSMEAIMKSFIEPLGLDRVRMESDPTGEFMDRFAIKNADGTYTASDPVIEKGIQAMQAFLRDDFYKPEDITAAVDELGEEGHSWLALMDVANIRTALESGNPDASITTYSYIEVDGISNGIMSMLRQVMSEFDAKEAINDPNSFSAEVLDFANAGGMYIEGGKYQSYGEYLADGGYDVYQKVIIKTADAMDRAVTAANKMTPKDVTNLRIRLENEQAKSANKRNQSLIAELKRELAIYAVKDIIPEFVVEGTNQVTKGARKIGKSYVLPKNYMSGDKAAKEGVARDMLDSMRAELAELASKVSPVAVINNDSNDADLRAFKTAAKRMNAFLRQVNPEIPAYTWDTAREPFSKEHEAQAIQVIVDGLGSILADGYFEAAGKFTETGGKSLNIIGQAQAIIVKHIAQQRINAAMEKKGGAVLSEGERQKIMQELADEGIYVGAKTPDSDADRSSFILDVVDRKPMEDAQGGYVQNDYSGDSRRPGYTVPVREFGFVDGELVDTGIKPVKSAKASIYVKQPSSKIGLRMAIGLNINQESATNRQLEGSSYDLFDAQLNDPMKDAEASKKINKVWETYQQDNSMMENAVNQLERLIEASKKFNSPELTGEINRFLEELNDHPDSPIVGDTLDKLLVDAKSMSNRINQARSQFNQAVSVSGQYDSIGNAYEVKESNVHGSSARRINLDTFKKGESVPVTMSSISMLWAQTKAGQKIGDTKEDAAYMDEIFGKHILPMVQRVRGLTVAVQNSRYERGGAAKGKNIFIKRNSAVRELATDMSDAEIMLHEFTHPLWEEGFRQDSLSLDQVSKLMDEAIASEEFTPEALMDKSHPDPEEAYNAAKQLYDYITSDVHEFATFGLTNARVRRVLNRIETKKTKGRPKTLLNLLRSIFEALLGRWKSYESKSPSTIGVELENIAGRFQQAAEASNKTLYKRLENKAFKEVNKKIVEPIVEWQKSVTDRAPDWKKALALPAGLLRSEYTTQLGKLGDRLVKEHHGILADAAREMLGPNKVTRPFHRMLSYVNEHVDSAAIRTTQATSQVITELFNKKLTNKQWKALTDGLLRTDAYVAERAIGLDGLKDIVSNDKSDEYRSSAVEDIRSNGVSKKDVHIIEQKVIDLVRATKGLPVTGEIEPNIAAIAYSTLGKDILKDTPTLNSIVNQIGVMYFVESYGYLSDKKKGMIKDMMEEESVGIEGMLEIVAANKEKEIAGRYEGDPLNMIAGDIGIFDPEVRIMETSKKNKNNHILLRDLGNGYGVFRNGYVASMDYSKGLFGLTDKSRRPGTFISFDEANKMKSTDGLFKRYRNGKLIGYELRLTEKDQNKHIDKNRQAHELIGSEAGRIMREDRTEKYNLEAIDMVYADWERKYAKNPKQWIKVSTNSKNRQVAEFARTMPKHMKDKANELFPNGEMYVRKEQLNLLLGFRKLSVAQEIERVTKKKLPRPVVKSIVIGQKLWETVISDVKSKTILFTPAVVLGNQMSNMLLLKLKGVDFEDAIRGQVEGLRQIKIHLKLQKEIAALEAKQIAGDVSPTIQRQIDRKRTRMESLGIHPLINEGIFQPIVEDLSSSEFGDAPVGVETLKLVSPRLADKLNVAGEKAPAWARKAGALMMLSPSTKLGNNIRLATSYSDVLARYVLFNHLRKTEPSKSPREHVDEIMDTFVDYAPNTSRGIQFLNDSGLYMYTKFLLRTQRIIARTLADSPDRFIGLQLAQAVVGDLPDIADSQMLTGISLGGGRTVTPDEAIDTVTQLPLFYALKQVF